MSTYSIIRVNPGAEVAAFNDPALVEAYLADWPHPDALCLVELEAERALCSLCGAGAITGYDPRIEHCRRCHYSGAAAEAAYAPAIERLRRELPGAHVAMRYARAGCFELRIQPTGEAFPLIIATQATYLQDRGRWFIDTDLPGEDDGPWGAVSYATQAELSAPGYPPLPWAAPMTLGELIAFARGSVTGEFPDFAKVPT